MNAYPVFCVNSDNYIGVVTCERKLSDEEVIELFVLHYPEYGEQYLFVYQMGHVDYI